MTDAPGGHDESLPLATLERIDGVCLEFEAAWKRDAKPRIEHYLGATQGVERRELLRELLLLDVDYRRRGGENPTVADYQKRFLKDSDLLPHILEQLSTVAQPETTPIHKEQPFPELKLPCRFGDYELLSLLGEGGMGVVYRARQSTPDRIVALKIIRPDRLATSVPGQRQKVIDRFRAEAQAVAQLEHHNILPVYDVGEIDGRPFFSMRYVEGSGLEEVLRNSPMPGLAAAALLEPVARAVHYAHSRDLVHRDIKPRNILLDTSGCPYVTDFGLAKSLASSQELTQTLEVLGTPAYMSPEQARGSAAVDCRTDVYSLGVTLYELLIGRPPFRAATPVETQRQVIESEPAPPRQLNSEIDRDLDTICLKCLEKDRERRYATAEELADELTRYQAGQPIHARPITLSAQLWRWCRRNRAVASLGATASLLLLTLAVGGPIVAFSQAEKAERIVRLLDDNRQLLTRAEEGERDAKVEADEARVQRDKARAAEQQAERARLEAAERAAAERRAKYIADMKRADYFWEMNDVAVVRALLDRYLPEPGEEDIRGFEWHYWWQQCHQELMTLRHQNEVQRVAISPDSQLVAAAEAGGVITLWDLKTGEPSKRLRVEGHDFSALSFSEDGKTLAAAWGEFCRVTMWDVVSGDVVYADRGLPMYDFTLHKIVYKDAPATNLKSKPRSCAAFDAQCARFAKSFTATTYLWERSGNTSEYTTMKGSLRGTSFIVQGKQVGAHRIGAGAETGVWSLADENAPPPRQRRGPVFCMAFSPDGTRLAVGGCQGTLMVWELADNKLPVTLQGHEGIVWSVAFSPDGATLVSAGADGRVVPWDVRTETQKTTIPAHTDDVQGVVFVREGKMLVSAGVDSTIKFWDANTGEHIATRKGHEGPLTCLASFADGQRVASASEDGTVRVWSVPVRDEQIVLQIPSAIIRGVAFSPDGRQLAVVVRNDPRDIATQPAGVPPEVSVDKLILWDLERAAQLKDRKLLGIHLDTGVCPAFSPDGRLLAVRAELMNVTRMVTERFPPDIPYESQRLTGNLRLPFRPAGPGMFFPDGQTLTIPDLLSATVELWNIPQGSQRDTFHTQQTFCLCVAVAADGSTLAAAADQHVQLWSAEGHRLKDLQGHKDYVRCVTFSHDAKTLASASSDGTVRLWNVETGAARATLRGHNGGVSWVAISPDDKTVASAGRDGTIRLWDLRSGEEKTTLRGHGGWVTSVAFSPDGRTLASTSEDGTLRLWRGAEDENIEIPVNRTE